MYFINARKKINFPFSILTAVLMTILFSATFVSAETFTVTRTDDRNEVCNSGVDCSLREALAAANTAATDDVIGFDPNVFTAAQTITLTNAQLEINKNGALIINGSGKNLLTISGNNQSRVFFINAGEDVTINNLTVSKGSTGFGDGGGIFKDGRIGGSLLGNLTLNNCNVINNNAGDNINSQITGGGGGIAGSNYVSGSVFINNSNINNNFGTFDGGIHGGGNRITITNSTVNGNSALLGSGGMSFLAETKIVNSSVTNNKSMFSDGGGIANLYALEVYNSTISDNSAGASGGGIVNGSTAQLYLSSSTISGNRAGIAGSGDGGGIRNTNTSQQSIHLSNTIIADNTRGVSSSIPNDYKGYLSSDLNNLIETNGDEPIVGSVGNVIVGQDPLLDPVLRDNGGPTLTHALLSGSPAINAGNNINAPATDQRGFNRIVGGTIDIGAVESNLQPPPAPTLCAYSISPTAQNFSSTSVMSSFSVTTESGCTWFPISNDSFIKIVTYSGEGKGEVYFSVDPNTGASRTGTITVAGQIFTINQAAPVARRKRIFLSPPQ